MKNITFLTKYTSQSATSRYRSFFFMRQMLNKDYNISVHSFLDSGYLQRLYGGKPISVVFFRSLLLQTISS
jgi:hypothetical protein